MNQTIDLILSHRSIRQFTAEPIVPEQLDAILAAAQAAASSSFLQVTSIIRVTELQARTRLVELAGNQPYVAQSAEFLVFCADYYRHTQIVPEAPDRLCGAVADRAIDGALMAQNALLAAQSLGLGGVYIGGIRNHPVEGKRVAGVAPSGDPAVWPLPWSSGPAAGAETPFAQRIGGASGSLSVRAGS